MAYCCARAAGSGKVAPTSTLLFSINCSIPLTGTSVRSRPTAEVRELAEGSTAALRDSRLRSEMAAAAGAGCSPQGRARRRRRGALLTGGLPRRRSQKLSRRALFLPRTSKIRGRLWVLDGERGALRAGSSAGWGRLRAAREPTCGAGVGKPRGVLHEVAGAALEGQKKAQPSFKYSKHTSASGGSTLSPSSSRTKEIQLMCDCKPHGVAILSSFSRYNFRYSCSLQLSSHLVRCHAACRGPTCVFLQAFSSNLQHAAVVAKPFRKGLR